MISYIVNWLIGSFLNGAFFFAIFVLLFYWFYLKDLPVQNAPRNAQFEEYSLTNTLQELIEGEANKLSNGMDSTGPIIAMNMVFQFLFQELKDTKYVRRYIIRKMTMEFKELLSTRTAGKMIRKITARDFSLGTSFPVIHSLKLQSHQMDKARKQIQEISLIADVEYKNGFSISVDTDLIFGRSAYVHIKIASIQGRLRIQLSRHPFTHWNLAFVDDPQIEFAASSHFDGRQIPQLTTLIENQLRRSIRRKHTLPNYKIRFKPFFEQLYTQSLYKAHLDDILLREAAEDEAKFEELNKRLNLAAAAAASAGESQSQSSSMDGPESLDKDTSAETERNDDNVSRKSLVSVSSKSDSANRRPNKLGIKTGGFKYSSLQYAKLCEKIGFDLTSVGQLTIKLKVCDRLPESLVSIANLSLIEQQQQQQQQQLQQQLQNPSQQSPTSDVGCFIFITLSVDNVSMKELMAKQICKEQWPILEFEISRPANQQAMPGTSPTVQNLTGLVFNEIYFINRNEVYIQKILPNSLASSIMNLKPFDIVHSFNQTRINSVKQLNKLILKTPAHLAFRFTVQRPCVNEEVKDIPLPCPSTLASELSVPLLKKSVSSNSDLTSLSGQANKPNPTSGGLLSANNSSSSNLQSLNLVQPTASSLYTNTRQRIGRLEQKLKLTWAGAQSSSSSTSSAQSTVETSTESSSKVRQADGSPVVTPTGAQPLANPIRTNQPITVVTHTASATWLVDYFCSVSECVQGEQLTDLDMINLLTNGQEKREKSASTYRKTRELKLVKENLLKFNNMPVQIDETYVFDLNDSTKYLNIFLWTVQTSAKHTKMRNLLVGYVTMPLNEINVDCWNTAKGETQSTIYFQPIDEIKASASTSSAIARMIRASAISDHPGFDAKVASGSLTLNMQHKLSTAGSQATETSKLTDSPTTTNEETEKEIVGLVTDTVVELGELEQERKMQMLLDPLGSLESGDNDSPMQMQPGENEHKFVNIQSNESISCEFCQRKIWFKNAIKCTQCGYTIHVKCYEKSLGKNKCSHRSSSKANRINNEAAGGGDIDDESFLILSSSPSVSQMDSSFQQQSSADTISVGSTTSSTLSTPRNVVSSFLSGIRLRRSQNSSNANNSNVATPQEQASNRSSYAASKAQSLLSNLNQLNIIPSRIKTNVANATNNLSPGSASSISPGCTNSKLNASDATHSNSSTDIEEFKDVDTSEEKFYGIDLYDELPVDERKLKYQETINKYQTSIDMMTKLKQEYEKELELLNETLGKCMDGNSAKQASLLGQQSRVRTQLKHLDDQMKCVVFLLMQCQIGLENCSEPTPILHYKEGDDEKDHELERKQEKFNTETDENKSTSGADSQLLAPVAPPRTPLICILDDSQSSDATASRSEQS